MCHVHDTCQEQKHSNLLCIFIDYSHKKFNNVGSRQDLSYHYDTLSMFFGDKHPSLLSEGVSEGAGRFCDIGHSNNRIFSVFSFKKMLQDSVFPC
jgi:hypothetical protein